EKNKALIVHLLKSTIRCRVVNRNQQFQGLPAPIFFGETMGSIALMLFGFIVIYAIVIVVAAFVDDFFRKNRSR
ncbi:hypothetical protein DPO00_28480, partial [Salmonella enterica]|nr:hypothetical protein [Salmonella enterica]